VKCRIGVDDQEPREALFGFVDRVAQSGCSTFVVHARKAWLKGLSPKENREVPPLDYPLVYELKRARPGLRVIINGGIATVEQASEHHLHVDGVMMGRAAYQSPWVLAHVDEKIFGESGRGMTRVSALEAFKPYMARELARGVALNAMTRHVLGLFNGLPGARAFRRHLSEYAVKPGAGLDVVDAALAHVREGAVRAVA
jgi:tRNA-dihydrouridine synthase A